MFATEQIVGQIESSDDHHQNPYEEDAIKHNGGKNNLCECKHDGFLLLPLFFERAR